MKKILHKILITVLCLGTLVLSNSAFAETLDTGDPSLNTYTKEDVAFYLGKIVTVTFIDEARENKIVVDVTGIIVDRLNDSKYLLLGRTKFRNRITIPIENIILIEEIR